MGNNLKELQESKNPSEQIMQNEQDDLEVKQEEILEEKIKTSKNTSIFKTIKSTLEKTKQTTQNLVLPKIRAKFKINSVFESVQDAGSIFKIERKIGDYLILIALFFFLTSFIEFIIILTLLPLKEKEPYLVTFTNDTQSFAIIQKADQSITANEALNRQLLGAYILSRESINRIDDKQRNEIVREQSSPEVWNVFERIIAQEDSIYSNENLTRVVKIVNIAIIKKGYANADVSISLFYNGILKSEKRYRIVISYKFKTLAIDYKSLPKNPTGFTVTGYSITEIATIKDLDEENKISHSKSRIKYQNNKEKNNEDILDDAYFYQESKENKKSNNTQEQNQVTDKNTQEDVKQNKDSDFNAMNSKTNKDDLNEKETSQIQEQIENIKIFLQQHQNDMPGNKLNELQNQLQELEQQSLKNNQNNPNNLTPTKEDSNNNTLSPFIENTKDKE
ncbi:type IV secretion system protein [Helicobacter cappadocius]|uniref:VirB8/TrbF family protein n=1 Tax=Helicobacter cappadocius TaxID=3063998 RepID=A0AA90PKF5_9HELI|nr:MULTISPECIES: VirB8/TrbF family protein [unclassified Helicobacter]MDO7253080.1 VirB8/TrbF family protein [Helicobacter sp. faydin-H75]MDP2538794.1 VirB8/TrbF family protein [Helicobacter sp. faydin-H76]